MENVIEIEGLTHWYGARQALEKITYSVRRGEVLGLLGPNGAGKTTTVRLLNGLFPPSSGRLRVLGLDPVSDGISIRRGTGVLTETPALYERLTARQNLDFFGTMAGLEGADLKQRISEMLVFFELEERADDRAGTFSKGMKQRLALARALLARPELLFLDEPTSGLDPEASQQVHELIDSLRQRDGHTVFICTHNLFEAQRLCDRLAIMSRGRLLAVGSLEELRQRLMPGLWVGVDFWNNPKGGLDATLRRLPGVMDVQRQARTGWQVQVQDAGVVPQVAAHLVKEGAQLSALRPQQVTLEEIYFKLQEQEGKE